MNNDSEQNSGRLRGLVYAARSMNFCVFYQDRDLVHRWSENLPRFWHNEWSSDGLNGLFLDPANAAKLDHAQLAAIRTGCQQRIELPILDGNSVHWFEFSIDPDIASNGQIQGLITIAQEISELKRREQVLKALLREVSHRSKNLLAIVQSIASQTARHTDTTETFLEKFQGRIQSLSSSQDLVTQSEWHGALFRELVQAQLERYTEHQQERITIEGDNPYLFPGAALHVGLAFHELIVNANAFGGLASDSGHVAISATRIAHEALGDALQIHWEEFNPSLESAERDSPRFGEAVLKRIVPASVNGMADYRIDDNKVIYVLTIPAHHYDLS